MARITVEDCIDKFPSRFELVLVASNRARKLHSGETPTLDKDNDKNTVIALREIAKETLTVDELRNDLVEEYQTATFSEDEELNELDEDNVDNANLDNNLIAENNLSEDENEGNGDSNQETFSTEDLVEDDGNENTLSAESTVEDDISENKDDFNQNQQDT